MFGNLGAFINGNMFAGLYRRDVFARLPEADRLALMDREGAAEFAPMPGKPMKEYVAFPEAWRNEPDKAREWLEKALAWVETMPVKTPKKKK
jgi:TfoX/Sxy family transcriptional regulator of competence genes